MKINIRYTTQLRIALGIDSEEVVVPQACTLLELLQQLKQRFPEALEQFVLSAQNELQPSVLLCVDNQHVGSDLSVVLHEGEEVTILSVISGG